MTVIAIFIAGISSGIGCCWALYATALAGLEIRRGVEQS